MTREEIIRLIIQCGMWSNDNGYYEGHIENIEEAMQEYADQETSALRAENERLRGLLKMANHLVGNPGTNISSSTDLACDNWQKEYSKLNSVNSLEVETSALKTENERMRIIMKQLYVMYNREVMFPDKLEKYWKEFLTENNL